MKKTLLLLALMALPGAAAPLSPADEIRVVRAQGNLKNFGVALEMWKKDHGAYPGQLQEMTPNYLMHIPPGPYGTSHDWLYRPSADGQSFQVAIKGDPFGRLGVVSPSYDSAKGMQGGIKPNISRLNYQLAAPEGWETKWNCYNKGEQFMHFSLTGPIGLNQTGPQWVQDAARAYLNRPFSPVVASQKPFQDRELSGIEQRSTWNGLQQLHLYVTDGQLGWEFGYGAKIGAYDPESEKLFWEIVRNRRKP